MPEKGLTSEDSFGNELSNFLNRKRTLLLVFGVEVIPLLVRHSFGGWSWRRGDDSGDTLAFFRLPIGAHAIKGDGLANCLGHR